MDRRMSRGGVVVVLVVALVVAAASAQNTIYGCWGGCYNECFLRSSNTRPEMLSCYYQCLNSCVPRSAADYQYYCQIGCSLELCIPGAYADGATLENCYGRCANLCKT